MARRPSSDEIAFGHMSFLDVLANSVGALTFLFLMFFVITSVLVTPSKFRMLTDSLPDGNADRQYEIALSAVGGTAPYRWNISEGSLPPGLVLNRKTGTITGHAGQEGDYKFRIRVEESGKTGRKAVERELGLHVTAQTAVIDNANAALRLSTDKLPAAVFGRSYDIALAATGGKQPYVWSVVGQLPPGLSIVGDRLTGAPKSVGNWNFNIKVEDGRPSADTRPVSIDVQPRPILTEADLEPVSIATTFLPPAKTDTRYQLTLAASGGVPPYSWSVAKGKLPIGLTLNKKTGVISGLPEESKTTKFVVGVKDSRNLVSATRPITMQVEPWEPKSLTTALPISWLALALTTIGTAVGLFFLAGMVVGVQCPWDKSWGCRVIGRDGQGRAIYACKHGHKFVSEIRQIAEETA